MRGVVNREQGKKVTSGEAMGELGGGNDRVSLFAQSLKIQQVSSARVELEHEKENEES